MAGSAGTGGVRSGGTLVTLAALSVMAPGADGSTLLYKAKTSDWDGHADRPSLSS